tara:strand:- start:89 stop:424 length:336 start_codon:yes stop_codon:yes gene_type:complete
MPSSRYRRKKPIRTDGEQYEEWLDLRGVKFIDHFKTPSMPAIRQTRTLTLTAHVWKQGDRYWKLAAKHYGDATYWWVIAKFNYRPTDAHCKLGDTIIIPKPLSSLMRLYGV